MLNKIVLNALRKFRVMIVQSITGKHINWDNNAKVLSVQCQVTDILLGLYVINVLFYDLFALVTKPIKLRF